MTASMWISDDSFMEMVLSFYLHIDSRDQILSYQVFETSASTYQAISLAQEMIIFK